MGYIDENLVQGEQVIFRTRYHWYVIVRSIVGMGVFFVFFWALAQVFVPARSGSVSTIGPLFTLSMLCIIPIAILGVLVSILSFYSSEFGVTNRRVLIKTGILRRQTLELSLSKVESFRIHESLTGRLLGFKSITLTGSGGTHQKFPYVDQAQEFRHVATEMATHLNDAPPAQHPPPAYMPVYSPAPRAAQSRSLLDDIDLPTEDTAQAIQQTVSLIRAGQLDDARTIVKGLTQTAPNNADVWYLVGFLSSTPDRKRQAYNRALSLDPTHRKAREGLAALG